MPGAPEYFSKVIDASEGLPSLEIFLYGFYKTHGVPDYFSEVVKALECLSSLEIFLYDFCKTPGVPGDL